MDKETIKKAADVARLNLTGAEYTKFSESFEDILGHFSKLHKEDLNDEDNDGAINVMRKDDARLDKGVADKIMGNAPQKENNLYKVPKGSK